MWNDKDGLYYDLDDSGEQLKCKTLACFWLLVAGLADEAKAQNLLANLKNPETFWCPTPFPSLAAHEPIYKADGQYWQDGVWAPTNVMIIKGLGRFGWPACDEQRVSSLRGSQGAICFSTPGPKGMRPAVANSKFIHPGYFSSIRWSSCSSRLTFLARRSRKRKRANQIRE